MRRLGLAALRARAGRGGGQRVVGAALAAAGLGVAAFWIRHRRASAVNERLAVRPAAGRPTGLALQRLEVEVGAAQRAQALAVLAAQRLHRQREVDCSRTSSAEVDLVVAVERGRRVVVDRRPRRGCRRAPAAGSGGRRRRRPAPERLEAPAARQLQRVSPADQPEAILVLVEHRVETSRRDDAVVVLAGERVGRVRRRNGVSGCRMWVEVENHSQGPVRLRPSERPPSISCDGSTFGAKHRFSERRSFGARLRRCRDAASGQRRCSGSTRARSVSARGASAPRPATGRPTAWG